MIDVRAIVPLHARPIINSVLNTGRLVVVSDSCTRGSWAHTLTTLITGEAFGMLDAAPVVVGPPNWITPPAELEDVYFPTAARLVAEVHHRLLSLPGYLPTGPRADLVAESSAGA